MYAKFEKNLTIATLAIKIQSLPKKFTKKFQTRWIFKILKIFFGHLLEVQTMDLWLLHIFFVLPTMSSAEFNFDFCHFFGGHFLKIHFSPGGHRGLMIFGLWKGIGCTFKTSHVSTCYPAMGSPKPSQRTADALLKRVTQSCNLR